MRTKHIIAIIIGIILVLVGGLWFLQGSDIVHIKPILCAANCTPITGHVPMWQIVGLITCFVGGLLLYIGLKHRHSA
jgi:hypothetical protein